MKSSYLSLRISFVLIIGILMLNCNSSKEKPIIYGTYESIKYNKVQKILMQMKGTTYVQNVSLSLKKDTTFEHISCGNRMTGRYELKGDSLVLTYITNEFRNDSLNQIHKPRVGTEKFVFRIDGNLLKSEIKLKGVNKRVLQNLQKISD